MSAVIRIFTDSDRLLLVLSLIAFAVAGVANTTPEAGIQTVGAMAGAVLGVYGLARYARVTARERLARLSLGLWCAFLGVAGIHLLGLETLTPTAAVPHVLELTLTGLTWGTLLGACTVTAFLGFQEYGTRHADDPVLENDPDYSQTR